MFANPEEARAWSVFFAAQCPRLAKAEELDAAAKAADKMLETWRSRVPPTKGKR